jgi:hypothetical protein
MITLGTASVSKDHFEKSWDCDHRLLFMAPSPIGAFDLKVKFKTMKLRPMGQVGITAAPSSGQK